MPSDEKAFRLRAPAALLDRIADLATRYGRRSSNTVIIEILENYAELWEAAEVAKREIVERQKARVLEQQSLSAAGRKRQG